jgi:ribosomal protein S18 acetylase RimI-like enzyme
MAAMTVRPATPTDAAALAEVAAVTFPLACPPDMPREDVEAFVATQLSAERFTAYLADPARIVLVDDPGGGAALAGYTMVVLGEPYAADVAAAIRIRPTAELSKIYVRPEQQGSGTARALLDRTLAAAADRGAAGMWLGTNGANARAQRFYAKAGFAHVGTRRFQVGNRLEHDVVMERPLP